MSCGGEKVDSLPFNEKEQVFELSRESLLRYLDEAEEGAGRKGVRARGAARFFQSLCMESDFFAQSRQRLCARLSVVLRKTVFVFRNIFRCLVRNWHSSF